ncbi:hypothetical protein BD410DRAFT_795387 [Rickenella mellea]|uniref:Uncharacterized protein n=1 Tax=Rickenella mellea TaxID=50990 RepID=A0A4Y7PPE8_9AGAM|nr:hypothetical protein BD410DRAFT_795387 [Rickenella mellea]
MSRTDSSLSSSLSQMRVSFFTDSDLAPGPSSRKACYIVDDDFSPLMTASDTSSVTDSIFTRTSRGSVETSSLNTSSDDDIRGVHIRPLSIRKKCQNSIRTHKIGSCEVVVEISGGQGNANRGRMSLQVTPPAYRCLSGDLKRHNSLSGALSTKSFIRPLPSPPGLKQPLIRPLPVPPILEDESSSGSSSPSPSTPSFKQHDLSVPNRESRPLPKIPEHPKHTDSPPIATDNTELPVSPIDRTYVSFFGMHGFGTQPDLDDREEQQDVGAPLRPKSAASVMPDADELVRLMNAIDEPVPPLPPFNLKDELERLMSAINEPIPPLELKRISAADFTVTKSPTDTDTESFAGSSLMTSRPTTKEWKFPVPPDTPPAAASTFPMEQALKLPIKSSLKQDIIHTPPPVMLADTFPRKKSTKRVNKPDRRKSHFRSRSHPQLLITANHTTRDSFLNMTDGNGSVSAPADVRTYRERMLTPLQRKNTYLPKLVTRQSTVARRLNRLTLSDPRSPAGAQPSELTVALSLRSQLRRANSKRGPENHNVIPPVPPLPPLSKQALMEKAKIRPQALGTGLFGSIPTAYTYTRSQQPQEADKSVKKRQALPIGQLRTGMHGHGGHSYGAIRAF